MVVAQLFFSLMVVCVKFAREELSGVDVVFWRALGTLPFLLLLCRSGSWRVSFSRALLFRIGFGFAAMSSFYIAAKSLAVADLSMLSKLMPVLVAIGAPLALGQEEKPESALWGVMIVAVVGCFILLMPSFQVGSAGGIWAVAAAVFSSVAHVSLRALKKESTWGIVLWFQLGTAFLALCTIIVQQGRITIPPVELWSILMGVAILGTCGQFCMTLAYAQTKASNVAAASYLGPLWAIGADLVFFELLPSWNFWLGGSLLIFAGVWLAQRQ